MNSSESSAQPSINEFPGSPSRPPMAPPNTNDVASWFPVVYSELRRLASSYLRGESPGLTLQTTSLVHEAYIKLMGQRSMGWTDRHGFFAAAATAMRRILVDHARARRAAKRGGKARREALDEATAQFEQRSGNLVELGDALDRLAVMDPRKASIVEVRFFMGLSVDETALLLDLSPRTVARDWNLARAWLLGELERAESKIENGAVRQNYFGDRQPAISRIWEERNRA